MPRIEPVQTPVHARGKEQPETGVPRFALKPDSAAELLQKPRSHRKAEARGFLVLFGGEKRVENLLVQLRGNAGAIVGNIDGNPGNRLRGFSCRRR